MRVLGLVWLGVATDRYEETLTFFRDTLGLAVEFDEPTTIELSTPSGQRVQVFGPGHPYGERIRGEPGPVALFEVDDLVAARTGLARAGLAPERETSSDAAWEWFHVRGPDGHLYALAARRTSTPG